MTGPASQARARQLLGLLDLTRLEDDENDTDVRQLCRQALDSPVPPAAVCVYPRFLPTCREMFGARSNIRLATVANFPAGQSDRQVAVRQCEQALAQGADEVDVVLPWRELLTGHQAVVTDVLQACRKACDALPLKVILETGMLGAPERIREAADLSIAAGADFLKTSTGKVPVNATLEAALIMLDAIETADRDVGLKISGGVRTLDDALPYVEAFEARFGAAALTSARFRIGASGLMNDLLGHLESA